MPEDTACRSYVFNRHSLYVLQAVVRRAFTSVESVLPRKLLLDLVHDTLLLPGVVRCSTVCANVVGAAICRRVLLVILVAAGELLLNLLLDALRTPPAHTIVLGLIYIYKLQ